VTEILPFSVLSNYFGSAFFPWRFNQRDIHHSVWWRFALELSECQCECLLSAVCVLGENQGMDADTFLKNS
jgi:hypothetical protein